MMIYTDPTTWPMLFGPIRTVEPRVVGKHTYYAGFHANDQTVLRFPGHEFSYSATLAGGTLVIDRGIVGGLQFQDISLGEDRAFLAVVSSTRHLDLQRRSLQLHPDTLIRQHVATRAPHSFLAPWMSTSNLLITASIADRHPNHDVSHSPSERRRLERHSTSSILSRPWCRDFCGVKASDPMSPKPQRHCSHSSKCKRGLSSFSTLARILAFTRTFAPRCSKIRRSMRLSQPQ